MKTSTSFRNHVYILMIGLWIAAASGCATSASLPVPTDEIVEVRLAIEKAEQVGARAYAPLELYNAEQKLAKAQVAIDVDKHERAARLLEQAKVDADLAYMTALSAKANEAVKELQAGLQILRNEVRGTN